MSYLILALVFLAAVVLLLNYLAYLNIRGDKTGGMESIFVQGQWMDEIAAGRKTVEGRTGPAKKWERLIGKRVRWFNKDVSAVAEVVAVRHYASLDDYLAAEWQRAAPHFASLDAARDAYLAIRTKDGRQVFQPDSEMNAIELRLV